MKVDVRTKALGKSIQINRLIGSYTKNVPGPTIIFIGGIHGNEPSGVFALHDVFNKLNQLNPPFKGEVYGFAGNLTALARSVRYVDKDLNRIWKPEQIKKLEAKEFNSSNDAVEDKEQLELYKAIKDAYHRKCPVYVFDLHTTSAESRPFTTIGDTLRNRTFAIKMPIPIILGIEEQIDGTLLNYLNELGFITLGFESGQHDALSSTQNHTAFIWLVLYYAKCMRQQDIPMLANYYKLLDQNSTDFQKIYEVRYRFDISKLKDFRMNPGFQNFQKIKKGEDLARNENGGIFSREKGMIFMPLYQKQGDDGFFVVREIVPFWLKVSTVMRKLHFEKILPYLPGIQKYPLNENKLIVNTKIARWYVLEFFHLLGYRRETKENGKLVVTKRKYDIQEP